MILRTQSVHARGEPTTDYVMKLERDPQSGANNFDRVQRAHAMRLVIGQQPKSCDR